MTIPGMAPVNTPGNIKSYVHTGSVRAMIEIVAWRDSGADPDCVASTLCESFSVYHQSCVTSVPSKVAQRWTILSNTISVTNANQGRINHSYPYIKSNSKKVASYKNWHFSHH